MTVRRCCVALAVLLGVLTAGACSDDPAMELAVEGGERGAAMYFDPEDPTVDAGRYEVTFDNVGAIHHELAIVDPSGEALAARSIPGRSVASFEVELEAGTYRMVCREPGHEAAGMVGTLTVTG